MLAEIASWPLDAESDDVGRYFLKTGAVDALESGAAALVAGPPGAGKSALTTYLVARGGVHRPTKRVAVKDALIAAFPRGEDARMRARAFARYIILFGAFEALIGEGKLQGSGIREIARLFALDIGDRAEAALSHCFSPAIVFEVFGATPAPQGGRPALETGVDDIARSLAPIIDDRRVFAIFDEADEHGAQRGAFDVLKAGALEALLCAVDDLSGAVGGLTPIITARRSVLDRLNSQLLRDWETRCVNVEWGRTALYELAAFRIARAASARFEPGQYTASSVIRRVFKSAERRMGAEAEGGRDRVWPYIWRRTRGRARDMIHFVRAACQAALARGRADVDAQALETADRIHAAYLRDEVAGELNGEWAQSEALLGVLAQINPRGSDAVVFQRIVEDHMTKLGETEGVFAVRRFIESLYETCAIGNAPAGGSDDDAAFRIAPNAEAFDYSAPVVVHRGLWPLVKPGAA